jgi:hypothetical protein
MTFRSIRRLPSQFQNDKVLSTACGVPWAPKQLREKATPVASNPAAFSLPAETKESLEKLSDAGESSSDLDSAVAFAEAEVAARASSQTPQRSSTATSSSSSSQGTPVPENADVVMTPRAQGPATSVFSTPTRPVYGLNPVTLPPFSSPPPALARVADPEAQPHKQQRIPAMSEIWNEVRLWAEAEEINLASSQLGAVIDLLDIQLDPAEVQKASIGELSKLTSLEGYTPVSQKLIPHGSKIFCSKWVDRKSKGQYKSRCTCADIKARYSKQELEKESLGLG